MHTHTTSLVIALAASLSFLAGSAAADNGKQYPGSMCTAASTSVQNSDGRVWNMSTAALKFECPAIKDEHHLSAAWVQFDDRSTVDAVKCRMKSGNINLTEGYTYWYEDGQSSVAGTGSSNVSFGALPTYDREFGSLGYYSMRCWLPGTTSRGQSSIIMYSVSEGGE